MTYCRQIMMMIEKIQDHEEKNWMLIILTESLLVTKENKGVRTSNKLLNFEKKIDQNL